MGRGRSKRIENSIHHKFILDCIEKDLSGSEIHRALLQKGVDISVPTINKFIKEVKKQGVNLSQFKQKTESAALDINKKLESMPELTGIFNRRNFLIDNLLDRRNKVLEFANEGKRSKTVFALSAKILETLEKLKRKMSLEEYILLETDVKFLTNYCNTHFLPDEIYPQLEDTLRKYTMDIHEICKYVEQWTSKYEIEAMMEKLTEIITRAAVETFGPLLKVQTEENRKYYINKFVNEVQKAIDDIKDYEIKLTEKKDVK